MSETRIAIFSGIGFAIRMPVDVFSEVFSEEELFREMTDVGDTLGLEFLGFNHLENQ